MPKLSRIAFLIAAVLLTGCLSNDDYGKVVAEFQHDSDQLARSFQALVAGANLVEENAYIDAQVFEAQPVEPAAIQAHDLLTPEEIELRIAAIHALADYTSALATLASGRPAAQIQADTDKASASLKALSSQASTALAKATGGSSTHDYSGPVSSAVSAIGEVLGLLEKRRGEAEVKQSLRKNDPQLTALFNLLSTESSLLYQRRRATLAQTGMIAFRNYANARRRTPIDAAELLQLSDRIKQYERQNTLIAADDPAPAIRAFQDAHDKLVAAVLAPKSQQKQTLAQLIASVRAFATEVTPMAHPADHAATSL